MHNVDLETHYDFAHTSLLSCGQLSLISSIDRKVMRLYIAANAPHAFIPVIYQHPLPLSSLIFGR